jgi:hypothetical protein
MFVRDFIHVDRPFDAVAPRFVGNDLPLEDLVVIAMSDATASFVPADESAPMDALSCIRGALRSRGEAIVVPLRCVSDDRPLGPSRLEGELEVTPFGRLTELGFEASYQRSSDDQGRLRHTRRVTELGVRSFLQSLGRVLET